MLTVKEVAGLTGVSASTLHYYDKISLLKPTSYSHAGYRQYNREALKQLQQILFFKELGFTLKDISMMVQNPTFNRQQAFVGQRQLLQQKRDRLDGLLSLLDKLISGYGNTSFKEFDMIEYTLALEAFVKSNASLIGHYGGDVEVFNRALESLKSDGPRKAQVAEIAIKQYGSIESYTLAMKKNMDSFPAVVDRLLSSQEQGRAYTEKSKAALKRLTCDLTGDVYSEEIKQLVAEYIRWAGAYTVDAGIDMGDDYWKLMAEWYLSKAEFIKSIDEEYGNGASSYIGSAIEAYLAGT